MNDLTTIVKEGQRVLTTQQLAEVYETDINNIQANFKRNKERFIEGKHYFKLEGEELKEFKNAPTNSQLVQKWEDTCIEDTKRIMDIITTVSTLLSIKKIEQLRMF